MSSKPEVWTVLSMLEWATDYFKKKDIPDPRHSIEWLLAEILGLKRLDLYLNFDRPLSAGELEELRPLVKRRATHEPLQYIIGHTDFLNARIAVNPSVLIPRIETEQLAEIILARHGNETLTVLDIGTGSGCIAVALKMERPGWQLSALDISEEALAVARQNAELNDVDIQFIQGDIAQLKELPATTAFDLIVSNPPYVMPEEKGLLEPQVVSHEPAIALFYEKPELLYKQIIRFAELNLKPEGSLYLEIHESHSNQILALFEPDRWQTSLQKDYSQKPRFITAQKLS